MEGRVIAIEALGKAFPGPQGPVPVLHGIDLAIGKGEIFGIIGRSGAGKSTLVRCINLLERPTRGRVLIGGREISALSGAALRAARHDIGMVFQHFNILSSRTVRDNVALPLELIGGLSLAQRLRRVDEMLDLVGLTDKANSYPAHLSGGQKQRVGIARALASRPSVLLCDEATSALDPETTKSILGLLSEINRTLGLTVVLITHEMQVIKEIAHRVAVLDQGRVVEQGRVFDLFTQPAHPVTRALVREVLSLDLPDSVAARLRHAPIAGPGLVVRITFTGPSAREPILSDLVRRFGLSINILHGQVDTIQDAPFGTLTVEVGGTETGLQSALDYVRLKSLKAEILGRVAAPDRAVA